MLRMGSKCLMAGVLTCWAHGDAWFKNANATGLFLKENGLSREGIDFLARNLGITSTDMSLWHLTRTVIRRAREKQAEGTLIPKMTDWMAVSLDNVNLRLSRHYGSNGQVDLVAGIGYHHAEHSESRVPGHDHGLRDDEDLAEIGFEGHFGREYPPARARMLKVASACARSIGKQKFDCLTDEARRQQGDFEVRVARKLIEESSDANTIGVSNRLAGDNIVITYMDVEQRGTKKVGDIMPYLDTIHERTHVGVGGGRTRVMVVGDQEIWKLLWEAKAREAEKYKWMMPWPGDWHLMNHALDGIYRKWGGLGIMDLAKAAECHDKKLESGDFHKRHFVLMAAMEALWAFCFDELEVHGQV